MRVRRRRPPTTGPSGLVHARGRGLGATGAGWLAALVAACVAPAVSDETEAPEAKAAEPRPEADAEPVAPIAPLVDVAPPGPAPAPEGAPAARRALPTGDGEAPPWGPEHEARIAAVQALVLEHCAQRELDPDLVNGVIWVESKFDPRARGPAGAQGLMQIMPATARGIARRIERPARPLDPSFNVDAGTWLLRRLLDRAEGNELHALIAYNRGWAHVRRHIEGGTEFSEAALGYAERVQAARRAFARSPFHAPAPAAALPAVATR